MAFKSKFKDLRRSPDELGREALLDYCSKLDGCARMSEITPRAEVCVAGEISSLRIVPRAGCPSLEATVKDGTGAVVAAWTGRRQIAGVAPGRRLKLFGRANPAGPGGRVVLYNPRYELL